jgi:hypothetical protein
MLIYEVDRMRGKSHPRDPAPAPHVCQRFEAVKSYCYDERENEGF